ncbi:D-alanyl-D-alanine carboxypeptidase family protein [Aciditerrimonas ferrireducens]|uniref:D-alanyl-D-alanine carboxypeptidase family protein n=1 Tax=Aciditerrimonas ferrireducens TaxID=667306 RepID=UPI002003D9A3|nr:hypothetical protein [Aciditerrimonas ferrireducens]MCK4176660.1 hypothetical protein [Aciditerrimonas ferrireducens]
MLGSPYATRRRRPGRGRSSRYASHRAPRRRFGSLVLLVVVLFLLYLAIQGLRPAPSASARLTASVQKVPGHLSLPWPSQGGAALAVDGTGFVGVAGSEQPAPIASIAKVMTSVVVLHDHPLGAGQPGPTITITPRDVAEYQQDVATQQSVLKVAAGEQLSEVQALEGLLIPSANNIAHVLARWDAGSTSAFVAKMNAEAQALGLRHTHFVSPSGLNPGTVSTPADLVRLGEVAMANPVFASIVAMPQVTLPVAGTVENYDYDLDHHGFIGIKTGSDSQAGGCFLFDAVVSTPAGREHVIGAVLGQQTPPIIESALNAATALVQALRPELRSVTLLRSGQVVGSIETPWGASSPVVIDQGVNVVGWPGLQPQLHFQPAPLGSSVRAGQRVGTVVLDAAGHTWRLPALAERAVGGPGLGFRLTNL